MSDSVEKSVTAPEQAPKTSPKADPKGSPKAGARGGGTSSGGAPAGGRQSKAKGRGGRKTPGQAAVKAAQEASKAAAERGDADDGRDAEGKADGAVVYQVREGRAILWPDGSLRGKGKHREVVGYNKDHKPIWEDVPPYTVAEGDPWAFPKFAHNLEVAPPGSRPVPPESWPRAYKSQFASAFGALADTRDERTQRQDVALGEAGVTSADVPELEDIDDLLSGN